MQGRCPEAETGGSMFSTGSESLRDARTPSMH
ncbi:protein of unknown function (plasmid) [Azospirillum baldaniorum]|uniref:Uncharacterized protein n=1 Tax=Azospirillum baldaniorum TaxID=1064539 RepID=A0A9P1JV48_9PROT|nr:protein of unknown function [Azospirillum baldaniorum]